MTPSTASNWGKFRSSNWTPSVKWWHLFRRIAIVLFALCHAQVFAGGLPAGPNRKLTVLTFNIKGLPWPLSADDGRFKKIAEILNERRAAGNAPDLVFLQEDFSSAAKILRKEAGFKHIVRGPSRAGHPLGSGLTVLSDLPVRNVLREGFGSACSDVDCLANKGVLAIEVDLGPEWGTIWVANTHLQAHRAFERSREEQMGKAIEFLKREIGFSGRPIILAGDFNAGPGLESYEHLLRISPFQDVGRVCLDQPDTCTVVVGESSNSTIGDIWQKPHDRQFVFNPSPSIAGGALKLTPIHLRRNFTEFFPGQYQDGFLSDHWGYEVEYVISRD